MTKFYSTRNRNDLQFVRDKQINSTNRDLDLPIARKKDNLEKRKGIPAVKFFLGKGGGGRGNDLLISRFG